MRQKRIFSFCLAFCSFIVVTLFHFLINPSNVTLSDVYQQVVEQDSSRRLLYNIEEDVIHTNAVRKIRYKVDSNSSVEIFYKEGENLTVPKESFHDLVAIARRVGKNIGQEETNNEKFATLGEVLNVEINSSSTLYEKFVYNIRKNEIYSEESFPLVQELLDQMATSKVVDINDAFMGSETKILLSLAGGAEAYTKLKGVPRNHQIAKNQFYFTDRDRFNSEIGAFHLDRLLGFRRALPVTGRVLKMSTEIFPCLKNNLLSSFYVSLDGNFCLQGECRRAGCKTDNPFCGSPDAIESSLKVFIPVYSNVRVQSIRSPWARKYNPGPRAVWEIAGSEYCDVVRKKPHFKNKPRKLLDTVDLYVLDFLTGTMERYHLSHFEAFHRDSLYIHFDHGKAFGNAFHDEMTILAPLYQCCNIRHSTVLALARFNDGPQKLSDAMRELLNRDPLAPDVIWEPNLIALDRRVTKVLQVVRNCVAEADSPFDVIINDAFL